VAEFQVVAKELERMCNTIHAVSGKCCTDECPLYCEDLCYAQAMVHVHGDEACNLEKVVMSWAVEHPEPVYPTWLEWMKSIGIIPYMMGLVTAREEDGTFCDGHVNITEKALKPIPADIAQKLGIEPKEG
jgi:hypothetical protein